VTKAVMTKLGLTINEAKTSLRNAREERFDFLGYSFGAHRFEANGNWYLGASPSKKSVQRLKTKIGDLLVPSNIDPWPEVCAKLNRFLRGWSNYFGYGSRSKAYPSVDQYVSERLRRFLARRHKVQGRGGAPQASWIGFSKGLSLTTFPSSSRQNSNWSSISRRRKPSDSLYLRHCSRLLTR
jgi:RNA-directed DNA polymerase